MKFCKTCGTRLRFRQVKLETSSFPALVCDKCGFYVKVERTVEKPVVSEESRESIKVLSDEAVKFQTMPTTAAECPKCGHNTAFWWMIQTRGGDESSTQFFRCEKCGHTWRQYS